MIFNNVVSRMRILSTTFTNVRSLFLSADKMSSQREQYLTMNLEEKRKLYRCNDAFKTLADVPTWQAFASTTGVGKDENLYPVNNELNEKISIFTGDITTLEIDAIVNAANKSLLGGGGVDGAIHRAAGKDLVGECKTLNGCNTGQAKITGGYKLPAKYVIHTVGPVGEKTEMLQSCYHQSLSLMKENQIRSIAFPCISTGVYGYPNEPAANVALKTTREFLQNENNAKNVERVIFCLFMPVDIDLYKKLLPRYFPTQ